MDNIKTMLETIAISIALLLMGSEE